MKNIVTLILLASLFGCASNNEKNVTPSSDEVNFNENINPLSKIKKLDINYYLTEAFKVRRSDLIDEYSEYIYVSKPMAYVVDSEVVVFAPWLLSASEFTVFPTAHYAVISQIKGDDVVGARYDMNEFLSALSEHYELKESYEPFFHYVLHVPADKMESFEENATKIVDGLKQLD